MVNESNQRVMGICRLCLGMFKSNQQDRKYCSDCAPLAQFNKRFKSTLKEFQQHGWKEKLQDAIAGSRESQG